MSDPKIRLTDVTKAFERIKSDLGVTVAVPGSSEQIAEALFEGALFREKAQGGAKQLALDFIDDLEPKKKAIHAEWENARDREKASRSRFGPWNWLPPEGTISSSAVHRAPARPCWPSVSRASSLHWTWEKHSKPPWFTRWPDS